MRLEMNPSKLRVTNLWLRYFWEKPLLAEYRIMSPPSPPQEITLPFGSITSLSHGQIGLGDLGLMRKVPRFRGTSRGNFWESGSHIAI